MIFYTYDRLGNYNGVHEHVKYAPIPPNSTTTAPPEEGFAVWTGDAWVSQDAPAQPPPGPDPAIVLQEAREAASLPRREFLHACVALQILTPEDALAAAKGEIPTSFEDVVAQMSGAEQFEAALDWAALSQVDRTNPLIEQVAALKGITPEMLDELFGIET